MHFNVSLNVNVNVKVDLYST